MDWHKKYLPHEIEAVMDRVRIFFYYYDWLPVTTYNTTAHLELLQICLLHAKSMAFSMHIRHPFLCLKLRANCVFESTYTNSIFTFGRVLPCSRETTSHFHRYSLGFPWRSHKWNRNYERIDLGHFPGINNITILGMDFSTSEKI